MRRLVLILLMLIWAAPAAYAQPADGSRVTQVDTSRYPEVTVYVSVTDSSGVPVNGLGASDFALTEDGQAVTITSVTGGGANSVSTVLVLDHSGSMEEAGKMEGAKEAAQAFVAQMRPGDQTALIAFSDEPVLLHPFSSDPAELRRAIRPIRPDGSTALYDSLIAGVEALDGASGRRALLLLTDGRDIIGTDDPSPASRASLDEALAQAIQAGISVQVIGLGDRSTSDMRAGIDEQVLRRIADETGGEYYYAPNAGTLAELYRSLASNLQQEYALTYTSPRPFYDGTRRDIRVSIDGAPQVSGGYLQQHVINVRSNPLVGLVLLLPILAALLLPLWRRSTREYVPAATGTVMVAATPDQPLAELSDTATDARQIYCDQCGKPMRSGSRFCSSCGAKAPVYAENARSS